MTPTQAFVNSENQENLPGWNVGVDFEKVGDIISRNSQKLIMISRNLQCHCSSKLRFSSFHSLSAHFCFAKKKSSRNLELLSGRPLLYCGSCWPLGGYRPTDVARNSSSADRWSEMVRSWGAGGALLLL